MTRKQSNSAVDFSRRISLGLLASVALLSLTGAALILWMAYRQNEVAAENTLRMVKSGTSARLERLATTTLDHSLWTAAYDATLAGDEEWLFENIGAVATEDGQTDLVIVIRPADAGRFMWDRDSDGVSPTGLVEKAAIDSVLALLDDLPLESRAAVSTYARSGGDVWMLSAARMTPSEGVPDGGTDADLPRQIRGILVGPALLSGIGESYLVRDLALAGRPSDGRPSLALAGSDGSPVGHLVWTPPRPGRNALTEVLAPFAIVIGLAGIGVVFANRYFIDTARRLERALVAAQAANRSKAEFIAGLSHELRTPLNGVIGLAQVLLTGDTLQPADREMIDVIHSSGKTQLGLIEDLLHVSSLDCGKRVLDTAPFDPAEDLRQVGALAAPAARAKGLDLEIRIPAGPTVLVLGDRHAFMQICTNLVGNAVKFTSSGSVGAELSLVHRAGQASTRLRVSDTGPGVDPERHAEIFERFYQIDAALDRAEGGAGLGLAITKSLVDLMDGAIRIDSAPGRGAVFTVDLKFETAARDDLDAVA